MLIAKVSAVVAAVLVMSSVSAHAMEFADRPGTRVANSMPVLEVSSEGDLARRQIHHPKSLLGTDKRTRDILESIVGLLAEREGPGRLSAEYSPFVVDFGNFEHRPIMIGTTAKVATSRAAMKFEDRPRHTVVDQIVTSSVRKSTVPFGLHRRPSAAEFCVGSIAPCGPLSLAQRQLKQDS